MYLINAQFRRARSKNNKEKPGVVFYRITGERPAAGAPQPCRVVNSDMRAPDDSVLQTERKKIVGQLRLLYCVIENLEDSGKDFTIDDVAGYFRKALDGEAATDILSKSRTDFPLRCDIVSVSREYRDAFRYVAVSNSAKETHDFLNYVYDLAHRMKAGSRASLHRKILSLLTSLRHYCGGKGVATENVDGKFVTDYAAWLKSTGIAESTQTFYLSVLRSVLNRAHEEGLTGPYADWFRKISTGTTRTAKKPDIPARSMLQKIESLTLDGDKQLALYRDMFMFGFYCGGMELVDIAHLTKSNIIGGHLAYRRRLVGVEKKIPLGRQALAIADRYDSPKSLHLFPLLDDTGKTRFETVRNYVTAGIKSIGRLIGFPSLTFRMNITAYNSMASEVCIPELLLKQPHRQCPSEATQ